MRASYIDPELSELLFEDLENLKILRVVKCPKGAHKGSKKLQNFNIYFELARK